MDAGSLWGDLEIKRIKTPTSIFKDQASALESISKGVIRGYVEISSRGSANTVTLRAIVPSLNNYSIDIVSAMYSLEAFPAILIDLINDDRYEELESDEFDSMLAEVLQSDKVQRVLQRILSDSS